MADFKKEAALGAMKLISSGQIVGLGAGATIAHLVRAIAAEASMAAGLTFASPSVDTINLLRECRLNIKQDETLEKIDVYFDGCDQFDLQLNALKSGGGIHAYEKAFAALANRFILLGDAGKLVNKLDATYPVCIEIIPAALVFVMKTLREKFDTVSISRRFDEQPRLAPTRTRGGNYLIDAKFETLPELNELNAIKQIPGLVDHSLFYQMAHAAVIAGPDGLRTLER